MSIGTDTPKISILTPSYNHEKFVNYFIEGVLRQTMQDFELIIIDDYSTDRTVEQIEKFRDPRIKLIKHSYNKGINACLNDAFEIARGKYCVFIASDDIMAPNHLEVSTAFLDLNEDVNVFYCSLQLINDHNSPITANNGAFTITCRNRSELLRMMFFDCNMIPSPGMVLRRNALQEIMPLDISLLQLQDYQMNVKLLLRNSVHLSEKKLVNYRIISGNKNISSRTDNALKRESLEQALLMDSYLSIDNIDLLYSIFGTTINQFGIPTTETIPYFLGRLALLSEHEDRQRWGYQVIMKFIKEEIHLEMLHHMYGFSFSTFIGLVGTFHYRKTYEIDKNRKKTQKYKRLFNLFLGIAILFAVVIAVEFYCNHFTQ